METVPLKDYVKLQHSF